MHHAPRPTPHAPRLALLACALVLLAGCKQEQPVVEPPSPTSFVPSSAHLEHLSEDVVHEGDTLRIVHIYADAPSYAWVADDDEGAACVDDAARAAVYYLRRYAYTGEETSRQTAQKLLAFVRYMQAESGLFYNFVWDNTLRINTEHENSVADSLSWWTARAVWALGEGARILKTSDPTLSEAYADDIRRVLPHLDVHLARYGQTVEANGFTFPAWLPYQTAADASSELLLGLAALYKAYPDEELAQRIDRLAEGIESARFGTMTAFPYGAIASFETGWHAWGNSQTMALATAGRSGTAVKEADEFFSYLLVEGWLHSLDYATREPRHFEQIAYGVRPVAVGLVRLYEQSGIEAYAQMAGLAASWFAGNNAAGVAMYDVGTGRGYDGIGDSTTVNRNSGAESTIEALMTLLEVGQHPEAVAWMHAGAEPPTTRLLNGDSHRIRVFENPAGQRLALVRNLTRNTLDVLQGDALTGLLSR